MTTSIYRSISFLFAVPIYLLSCVTVYAADPPVTVNVVINGGDSTIDLTENTTTNVTIIGTISDATGCSDVTGVTVKFYKTTTGPGASDDPNNHYTMTTPTDVVQDSCVDLIAIYTATIPVEYYADPAEWTAQVIATDGTEGTPDTNTTTINPLSALDVTSTIDYGTLALGLTTGISDQVTTITNTGNISIATEVDGYGSVNGDGKSMNCTIGSISIFNEKYSITSGQDYSTLKNSLTDTSTVVDSFSIAKTTTGAPSTGNIYWGFGMPVNGVGGSCTGKVVFTAI